MTDWAVITTLNEQASIGLLVAALRGSGLEVVVVDDGSEDDTIYVARNAGAYVIDHMLRTGIGPSLVEGWRCALQNKPEHVVQLDAGGSHDPKHIAHMVHRLHWAEVVVGSRFVKGAIYEGNIKRAALRMNMRIDEAPIIYTAGRSSFNRRVAREALKVWAQ